MWSVFWAWFHRNVRYSFMNSNIKSFKYFEYKLCTVEDLLSISGSSCNNNDLFYLSGHLNGPNPWTVNNTQWQVCWIKGIEDKMLLRKCLYRSRLLTTNTWQRGRIPLNTGGQNPPTLSLGANIPIERSSYPKRFPPSCYGNNVVKLHWVPVL